jgi:U3 small nucleolar RNA-associated protein 3
VDFGDISVIILTYSTVIVMHNRDKISLAPERVADDEEDFIDNQGEEVFSLNLPTEEGEDQLEDEYDEEEEEAPAPKARKSKPAEDKSKKGRYAKESDDDESLGFTDEESESDEDEDRAEESWGRQYYAKPSNRYARDAEDDDYDSDKELSKNLYAQESEALQKNIRRSMKGDEDFGLEEIDDEAPAHPDAVKFSLDR